MTDDDELELEKRVILARDDATEAARLRPTLEDILLERLAEAFPNAGNLQITDSGDDALFPMIRKGSAVVFDSGDKEPAHGGVFLFRWADGTARPRRVYISPKGGLLVLLSDNPDKRMYPDESEVLDDVFVPKDEAFNCLGRVLWVGGVI